MTTTVASVISPVRDQLMDPAGIRWSTAELLRYIDDAQRYIASVRPESTATHGVIALVPGTLQSIPSVATRLLDISRNTNAAGTANGRAIRLVDRETLDSSSPYWHDSQRVPFTNEPRNYVYNQAVDPRVFYTYPGVKDAATAYVHATYAVTPAYPTENGSLAVADTFSVAVINYVLFRAYSKETEYGAEGGKAQLHLQLFLNAIGEDIKVAKVSSPNARRLGTEGTKT